MKPEHDPIAIVRPNAELLRRIEELLREAEKAARR